MNETDWTRVELFHCLHSFTEPDWTVRFKVKLILYGLIAELLSRKVSQPELVRLVNSVSQFLHLLRRFHNFISWTSSVGFTASLLPLSLLVELPSLVRLVNSVSQPSLLSLSVELPELLIHPQSLLNLFLLCKLNHLLSLPLNLLYWLIQSPSPRSSPSWSSG